MKFLGLMIATTLSFSCALRAEKTKTEEALEVNWDDLITATTTTFSPQPHHRFELLITEDMLSSLPNSLQSDPALSYLSLTRFLSKPEKLGDGVFGRVNGAGRFAALLSDVQDWDRLYWAQVEVLSKKYACFIKKIARKGDEMTFTCRDNRYVTMWRERGHNWIEFYSRLYNKNGEEIRKAH